MCVRSIGVQLQHLSVSIRPVFHRHLSWSSRQLLLTQRHKGAVQPQPLLFADVVVVLHGSAFDFAAQRGLRDDQQVAGELQHRHHLLRVGLAQPQVQQSGHWMEEETILISIFEGRVKTCRSKVREVTDPSWARCRLWLLWRNRCRSPLLCQSGGGTTNHMSVWGFSFYHLYSWARSFSLRCIIFTFRFCKKGNQIIRVQLNMNMKILRVRLISWIF